MFAGIAICSAFIPSTFYTSIFDEFVLPIMQLCSECTTPQFFKPFVLTLEFTAITASVLAIIMLSLYMYEKVKISKTEAN